MLLFLINGWPTSSSHLELYIIGRCLVSTEGRHTHTIQYTVYIYRYAKYPADMLNCSVHKLSMSVADKSLTFN